MMLRIVAAFALIATPALVTAQSNVIEEARAAYEDWDRRDEARAMVASACEAGDSRACRASLAELDNDYDKRTEARALAARMCDSGDALACVTLARYADDGVGGDIDQPLERASLIAACRAGLGGACINAGQMAQMGEGGQQDKPLARELAGLGCDAGDSRACQFLGGYLNQDGWDAESDEARDELWAQSRAAYQKGCEAGDPYSCTSFAGMLAEGKGGEEDRMRAMTILDEACKSDFYQCKERLEFERLGN